MTQEPVGAAPPAGAAVAVTYGVYQLQLELAGRSVAEARAALAGALNIDPRSMAVVNGQPVESEALVLRPGDRIEFVRLAGQKGWGLNSGLRGRKQPAKALPRGGFEAVATRQKVGRTASCDVWNDTLLPSPPNLT